MIECKDDINKLNQEIDNVVEAINMYIKLFAIFRSINTASFTLNKLHKLTQNILDSKTDEELLLNLTVDVLKIFRSKKVSHYPNCIPLLQLLRLSLYSCLKYSFY